MGVGDIARALVGRQEVAFHERVGVVGHVGCREEPAYRGVESRHAAAAAAARLFDGDAERGFFAHLFLGGDGEFPVAGLVVRVFRRGDEDGDALVGQPFERGYRIPVVLFRYFDAPIVVRRDGERDGGLVLGFEADRVVGQPLGGDFRTNGLQDDDPARHRSVCAGAFEVDGTGAFELLRIFGIGVHLQREEPVAGFRQPEEIPFRRIEVVDIRQDADFIGGGGLLDGDLPGVGAVYARDEIGGVRGLGHGQRRIAVRSVGIPDIEGRRAGLGRIVVRGREEDAAVAAAVGRRIDAQPFGIVAFDDYRPVAVRADVVADERYGVRLQRVGRVGEFLRCEDRGDLASQLRVGRNAGDLLGVAADHGIFDPQVRAADRLIVVVAGVQCGGGDQQGHCRCRTHYVSE